MHSLISGCALGLAAGCTARLTFGPKTCTVRTQDGVIRTVAAIAVPWAVFTYTGNAEAGAWILGIGLGYLFGQLAGSIVEILRRRPGNGEGNGGSGGWGGGGGWDGPEDPAPWGPGPTDFKPASVPVLLTMEDFERETTGTAPAGPVLYPVGR
jgi:hypothetical protein